MKEKNTISNNVACRVFKEQIDLINQLPEEERASVLYASIMNAFNQFDNQNDIQTENQNENAYVSVSVSVSLLGNSIINLLSKNIVAKEFSSNYGGRRNGSGRPPAKDDKPKKVNIPFEDFYKHYPVKKSKVAAENKWKTLSQDIQSKCIEVVTSKAFKDYYKDNPYIKHPSTWLNQGCWDDELGSKDKPKLSRSTFMMEV